MKTFTIVASSILLCGNVFGAGLEVKELKRDKPVDFQSEILPMLRSNCLACHNRTRSKGDVILETPADIRKGNDDGSFVEPGKAKDSFLFTIAAHLDDPVMPPAKNKVGAKNMKPEELGLLKLWIEQGAKGEMRAAAPVVWQSYRRETPPIYAVAAGPHGRFAAAGRGNQIHLYDATVGKMLANLADPSLAKHGFYGVNDAAHLDVVNALAFHPNGRLLASGGFRVVKLWQRSAPAKKKEFVVKALDGVRAVSSDGKWLAVAEENNQTGLWDLSQGKRVRGLEKLQPPVKGLAFSPNSARLVSGAADGSVRVWNVADGKLVAETVHEQGAGSVAILGEEGKWFASAHADKIIRVWELPAEQGGEVKMLKELKGHTGDVTILVAMPNDPNQLVSGAKDNTARIWSAEGGTAIRSISVGVPVLSLAVSSDGQRIATSDGSNVVRLWNATNGQKVVDLQGNTRLSRDTSREDGELAFSKAEVKYFTDELKKRGDEKKKVIDRRTKGEKDLKTAQGKPIAEKKVASDKARTERDAADKKVEETTKKAEETQKAFEAKETASKEADAKSKDSTAKATAPEAAEKKAVEDVAVKKTAAAAAQKALDTFIVTKQKPATTAVTTAANALTKATTDKAAADKAFVTAKTVLTKATTDSQAADKVSAAVATAAATAKTKATTAATALANATKDTTTKKTTVATAKQALDTLVPTKQKPAMTAATTAATALSTATADKTAADKALATAKTTLTKVTTDYNNSEAVAKTAEAKAKAIALETKKPKAEKDKATADAVAKRTLVTTAKTVLVTATTVHIAATAKATAAGTVFTTATTNKANADKALVGINQMVTTAMATLKAAETALTAAEAVMKTAVTADAKAKTDLVAADKFAGEKKVLATTAKTVLTTATTAQTTATTKATAAGTAFTTATTNKANADKALVTAEAGVKKARETLAVSQVALTESEKKAAAVKVIADKARKVRDDATKVLADTKKVFGEAQKLRDDSKKAKTDSEADAKKKEAALTKAEKEYLDIENPRAQFERELKRAGQDLVKAEAKEKEYQGFKTSAENDEKRETDENKASKETLAVAAKTLLRTIGFSPDGSVLYAAGDGKYAQVWNAGDGQPLESIELSEAGVDFLAFTEDGSLCVAKGDTSALWDVFGKWELSKVLGGDEAASPIVNRVTSLDFSPDGKHLASGGGDPSRTGEILVWNLEDGKLIHNLPGVHSDTVHAIEFSRDGKRLASGAADKFARVTEIKTGALVHSFEGHTHHVMGVSLQANGRVLASVGADKEIKVWNVVNGDRAGKGGGYTKEITSIHFVGYGDNALITTADKKAKVIRVPLGNPGNVRDLSGVADVMHAGDVSRNGKVAVAGGEDGVFRVWNIADGKALQTFEPPAKEDPDGLTAN